MQFHPRPLILLALAALATPAWAATSLSTSKTHRRRTHHAVPAKAPKTAVSRASVAHAHAAATPAKATCRVPLQRGLDAGLCAAARGPKNGDTTEKAALEIPDLKTPENATACETALKQVKGVKNAIVDLNTRLAVVDYDPGLTELPHFLDACKDAGFEANEYRVESRFPKPIKLKGG